METWQNVWLPYNNNINNWIVEIGESLILINTYQNGLHFLEYVWHNLITQILTEYWRQGQSATFQYKTEF